MKQAARKISIEHNSPVKLIIHNTPPPNYSTPNIYKNSLKSLIISNVAKIIAFLSCQMKYTATASVRLNNF
ncbi:hypothetical protein HYC85_001550 [Camellia sinensis]|uniref:Uncharacterized protein n=1 Tax=Camellia sinensis TaxID=4442 RepID=A0A7J7I712_CAMSI|nr:hypothetical protein HYC85_001550 [Camellia sinensis]